MFLKIITGIAVFVATYVGGTFVVGVMLGLAGTEDPATMGFASLCLLVLAGYFAVHVARKGGATDEA